jgi:hypothetical protein
MKAKQGNITASTVKIYSFHPIQPLNYTRQVIITAITVKNQAYSKY